MIVLDASSVLCWLLGAPGAARVAEFADRASGRLHAPQLLDLEVVQVLRRYAASREVRAARIDEAFADFRALPVTRYAHELLLPRIWQLRGSLTAYDAAYVALAEALDAPLLTTDAKLARSHGHGARIELIRS